MMIATRGFADPYDNRYNCTYSETAYYGEDPVDDRWWEPENRSYRRNPPHKNKKQKKPDIAEKALLPAVVIMTIQSVPVPIFIRRTPICISGFKGRVAKRRMGKCM